MTWSRYRPHGLERAPGRKSIVQFNPPQVILLPIQPGRYRAHLPQESLNIGIIRLQRRQVTGRVAHRVEIAGRKQAQRDDRPEDAMFFHPLIIPALAATAHGRRLRGGFSARTHAMW